MDPRINIDVSNAVFGSSAKDLLWYLVTQEKEVPYAEAMQKLGHSEEEMKKNFDLLGGKALIHRKLAATEQENRYASILSPTWIGALYLQKYVVDSVTQKLIPKEVGGLQEY